MSSKIVFLVAGLLTFAAPAIAEEVMEDPVVAEVDGQKIHMSDIEAAYDELPPEYRQLPITMLFKPLVERVIDDRLLQAEAERQRLDSDPVVLRELERARGRVLRAALLQKIVDAASTEDKLRAAYEAMKTDPAFTVDQWCASHILVASEAEARALIAELKAGADFAELARTRSRGATGSEGGDLGCFAEGSMVPEFEAALTSLSPGTFTEQPVQTRFGWHVVFLREHKQELPSFEEAEGQVREHVARAAIRSYLAERRAAATILRHEQTWGGMRPAGH